MCGAVNPPLFAKFLKKCKFCLTSINFNDEMSSFHFDPQKQNELSPNSFFSPPELCVRYVEKNPQSERTVGNTRGVNGRWHDFT